MILSNHQQIALDIIRKKDGVYLDWQIGEGKTYFSCFYITKGIRKYSNLRSLIVCPRQVFSSFKEDFDKVGLDRRKIKIILDAKDKRKMFDGEFQDMNVLIMNYETFKDDKFIKINRQWKRKKEIEAVGYIQSFKPHILIMDEAHKIKNVKTAVGKKAQAVTRVSSIKKKILMSGTPLGNSFEDLFNPMFVLDGGKRLGDDFHMFMHSFFVDLRMKARGTENYFPKYVLKKGAKEKISKLTSDLFHKHYPSDKKHLPDKRIFEHTCKLSLEQRDQYIQAIKLGFIDIEFPSLKKEVEGSGALYNTLRQICCGFFYTDTKRNKAVRIECNKPKVLKAIIERINIRNPNEKFIIWTVFKETYKIIGDILDGLGIEFVELTGKTSSKKAMKNIENFKKNPKIRCVIGHPASAGAGINLQQARSSIYYSQDYSFINQNQSEGRNFRRGSKDFHPEIEYHFIYTEKTIEDKISKALKTKEDLAKYFRGFKNGLIDLTNIPI